MSQGSFDEGTKIVSSKFDMIISSQFLANLFVFLQKKCLLDSRAWNNAENKIIKLFIIFSMYKLSSKGKNPAISTHLIFS